MKAALHWVLDLEPSLLDVVDMEFISTSMGDQHRSSSSSGSSRQAHEKRGVAMIERLKKKITTAKELQAYLLLGGHRGLRNYVLNQYQPSTGGGW